MNEKVVVVGAGMVGHRFAEELVRADRAGRFSVELVGEEEYDPYNRILLSDVLAGRSDLKASSLPLMIGPPVLRGGRCMMPRSAGS